LYVPGALLGAPSAGRTTPDIFTFYLGQTERGLADELAHAEGSNLVPRANHIAQSALEAPFEGVSTARFDDIDDLFVGGYRFHFLPLSSSFTL
jgi:hypothetical protein